MYDLVLRGDRRLGEVGVLELNGVGYHLMLGILRNDQEGAVGPDIRPM